MLRCKETYVLLWSLWHSRRLVHIALTLAFGGDTIFYSFQIELGMSEERKDTLRDAHIH